MKKVIFAFVTAVLLVSCKQSVLSDSFVQFDQSQPVNVKSINSFPNKYLGTFAMDESHQITINPKSIYLNQIDTMEVAQKDLDSIPEISFKNNQVIDKQTGKTSKAWVKKDTIYWQVKSQDTLFSFAENEVAKEFKSSLILNRKEYNSYKVSCLTFHNSGVNLVQLGTKRDAVLIQNKLKIHRDVVIQDGDTTHVVLSPTRADFRKLLRLEGLEYQAAYPIKK